MLLHVLPMAVLVLGYLAFCQHSILCAQHLQLPMEIHPFMRIHSLLLSTCSSTHNLLKSTSMKLYWQLLALWQVVSSSQTCAHPPAGGTAEQTDVGPTDAEHARSAQAAFVFAMSGTFQICYKLADSSTYEQVGSALINVNPSHKELVQEVYDLNTNPVTP